MSLIPDVFFGPDYYDQHYGEKGIRIRKPEDSLPGKTSQPVWNRRKTISGNIPGSPKLLKKAGSIFRRSVIWDFPEAEHFLVICT